MMTPRVWQTLAVWSCVVVVGMGGGVAHAAGATQKDAPAPSAEAVFLEGRTAMEAGHFEVACAKFAESERLERAAGTLMNLATCEEKLVRLASAWQHWKEAIDLLPGDDDRVAFARGRVDDLEKKLPRLVLTVKPGADVRTRVARDGIDLGAASWGVPLPVDPGPHEIVVTAPGRLAARVTVSVAEAEQKSIEVQPGLPAPPPAEVARRAQWRTVGWGALGLGLAGAAAAVVTGIMVLQDKKTADANCPNMGCVNQKGLDAVSQGKTLVGLNAAAFAVAAVGLGAGAYLVLSNPPSPVTAALGPSGGRPSTSASGVFVSYAEAF